MQKITFTITEEEICEVANEELSQKLTSEEIKEVLSMVECDEMLWKDIRTSIVGAIQEIE